MSNDLILSPSDEYFTHQIPLPHHVVGTSDPNWRERYWFSIHDTQAQDFVLSAGFGKYPNRDVMDGFAIAAKGDTQRNLRCSRQLTPHFHDVAVGPFSVEVIKPLELLRLKLDPNDSGIAYDLTWEASAPPALEGRHFEINRNRVSHDLVRYVQTGRLNGEVTFGDERLTVTPDRWWGVRDHSWGMRPMSAVPGDPPVASVQWNFLGFIPIQFPSFSIHVYLFESQPGRPTHLSASIMRPTGAEVHDDEIRGVTHDFEWVHDAPIQTLVGGRITIDFFDKPALEIDVRACPGRAFLKGGGYGSTQGKWFGESHAEQEKYDLTDKALLRDYNSHSSDHLIEARCNGETGYGIIEYMIRRGYGKYAEAHRSRKA
ncbi:hypothetical protein DM806_22150 [Sphingobium lactosutens]|uniref:hypothetical protein n=1 Tax=Sphingobium lactosutens TaxID=522773 RepID=UPI0015BE0774|nr:hypothetical protein [Sphingobium lactosutens]NWK98319.1 hypothetical protein [Sphingobium lactosutens]